MIIFLTLRMNILLKLNGQIIDIKKVEFSSIFHRNLSNVYLIWPSYKPGLAVKLAINFGDLKKKKKMSSIVVFRRLLLPALNIKKTLGYTVLLPPKNLSCVTSQFYQFTTGTGFLAKKSKPLIQKAVKEKKSRRKYLTNRICPTHYGEPTKPKFILTKDIPNYFCNPILQK